MPSVPPTITPKPLHPATGGGGRGPIDREPRGGGGGGGGGRDDDRPLGPSEKLKRYRLGLYVTATSILMLFVSFTSIYIARRSAGRFDPITGEFITDWVPVELPMRLFLLNSVVLALGSLTAEKARRSSAIDAVIIPASRVPGVRPIDVSSTPWVYATALLGLSFLLGQWFAWEDMNSRGIFLATGPASSFVFLLTGAHAVHLAGGILVLAYATLTHRIRKSLESRRITFDVSALYWHFMGLLWLYIMVIFLFVH